MDNEQSSYDPDVTFRQLAPIHYGDTFEGILDRDRRIRQLERDKRRRKYGDSYHFVGTHPVHHPVPIEDSTSFLNFTINDRTFKIEAYPSKATPFWYTEKRTTVFNRREPEKLDVTFSYFYNEIIRFMMTAPQEAQSDWLPLLNKFRPNPLPF